MLQEERPHLGRHTMSNCCPSFLFTTSLRISLQPGKNTHREVHVLYTCRHITRSLTSLGSKYDLASMFSRWRYLSGFSCFSLIIGSVCRRRERAAPNSRSSISSRTIYGSRVGTDCDEKSQIPFQFS